MLGKDIVSMPSAFVKTDSIPSRSCSTCLARMKLVDRSTIPEYAGSLLELAWADISAQGTRPNEVPFSDMALWLSLPLSMFQ